MKCSRLAVAYNPGENLYILHQSQIGLELRSQQSRRLVTRRVPVQRLGFSRNENADAAGPQAWDGLVALNTHLLPLYQPAASAVPDGNPNKHSTCDLPRVV